MKMLYIKAYFKKVPIEVELASEKRRLKKILDNEPTYNALRTTRDIWGFGRLKISLLAYAALSLLCCLVWYYTDSIYLALGLASPSLVSAVMGVFLLIKHPVSKQYWLN